MSSIRSVTYRNLAWDTSAHLHLPPDFDESRQYPAIVVTHPTGSCKEQTAGNVYAPRLAEAGFVVLVHDASFQGDSGGEPRFIEDPYIRVGDIRFGVDYLQSLPFVDPERVGALGMCGGGGYTIHAGITDHRIKAIVSITGANFGRLMLEGFAQFKPLEMAENIARQRTALARGGQPQPAPVLPESVEDGRAAGITDIDILEATDYYRNPARGKHPHGTVTLLPSFYGSSQGWDAFLNAEVLLTQPLMVVIGDKPGGFGAYRDGWEIFGRAASKVKEIVVVEGHSHYELYDDRDAVNTALARVIPFLQQNL